VGKVHTCTPFTTCRDVGFGPPVDVPDAVGWPGLSHLELETLGDRQVLLFQANVEFARPGLPPIWVSRVYFTQRCLPDGDFESPRMLRAPIANPEEKSQSLEFGRPRIVIDDVRRLAHVLFVETDTLNVALANKSALVWLWTEVDECSE
jgi:hypothetical protein